MAQPILLVPTDFSAGSRDAMQMAARIAPSLRSTLVLLHVTQLPPPLGESTPIRPTPERAPVPTGEFVRDASRAELERYADELRSDGMAVESRVELGDPVQVILQVAQELEPAMIVMGTHGRTGLAHLLIGSVAEKVMRLARRPVLTVPLHPPS